MTTRGALGTGVRYGYHGGAGPQVPGGAPAEASEWKLGRMSWGAAAGAGATDAPTVSWGDFGFGWRGYEGAPSDGAKIGREVFGGVGTRNVLAGMGWSWSYDAGVRLTEAVPGVGSLSGQAPSTGETADRFTFTYGTGDELLERLRQATGEVDRFTTGDYGRIASRDGVAFSYDGVGRRLEDDRFVYRWDWRGQLVEVTVRDNWPDDEVSPYAGHRLSYDYDAGGRLHRRLHEGVDSGDGTRPFIEERRYVWESDRMAVEAGYGADGGLRWRHTYMPGPSGLDDAPQVVVEIFQPGSPFFEKARTYTYLTDELGTIVGLVAEDEGADPNNPPVPVRYRYTPYGEAHVETGPELLRARFDGDVTAVETGSGTVEQTVGDESVAASGGLTLRWSVPLDGATLSSGLVVERLVSGSGWQAVPAAVGGRASDGVGTGDDGTELRVALADGWERGASYRVRLAPGLIDELGRPFERSETLQWSVPTAATESVRYERRWATEYETFEAARATVGGRMPGGQGRLFQGLWTDPVTGVSHARARWYDARNGVFLTEDPMGSMDSSNLYAFGAWAPSMHTDPTGEFVPQLIGGVASVAIGAGIELATNLITGDDSWDYGWEDAGVDFVLGAATSGMSNLAHLRHVQKLGRAGRAAVRVGAEVGLDVGAEIVRHGLKGEDWSARELAAGAARNAAVGELGAAVGRRLSKSWGSSTPASSKRSTSAAGTPKPGSGLGDSKTSPWLADSRPEVGEHLEEFREGGSYLLPEFAYKNFVEGKKFIGSPDGQFITTRATMDELLQEAAGDLGVIKARLGIAADQWNERLYRVDVHDPLLWNARLPSGFESRASDFFRWGGYTSGGIPEIVIDPFPSARATVTPTDIRP